MGRAVRPAVDTVRGVRRSSSWPSSRRCCCYLRGRRRPRPSVLRVRGGRDAAKEGALVGSRAPICDAPARVCAIRTTSSGTSARAAEPPEPDGSQLDADGPVPDTGRRRPRAALKDCAEGDTYAVRREYAFQPTDPDPRRTSSGDLNSTSTSRGDRAEPRVRSRRPAQRPEARAAHRRRTTRPRSSRSASSPTTRLQGYYRSPCSTLHAGDPTDILTIRFEQGTTITYKITSGTAGSSRCPASRSSTRRLDRRARSRGNWPSASPPKPAPTRGRRRR